jgi:hypothetical protein
MKPVVVESPNNSHFKGQQWELRMLVDVSGTCIHLLALVGSEKGCTGNSKLLGASPVPCFPFPGYDWSQVRRPSHVTDMLLHPNCFFSYPNQIHPL